MDLLYLLLIEKYANKTKARIVIDPGLVLDGEGYE